MLIPGHHTFNEINLFLTFLDYYGISGVFMWIISTFKLVIIVSQVALIWYKSESFLLYKM